MNDDDVKAVIQWIDTTLPAERAAWPGGYPDELDAAITDSVFSVRARYGQPHNGVRQVVSRWRAYRGDSDGITALASFHQRPNELRWILGNHQEIGHRSKADIVAEVAHRFGSNNIRNAQSVRDDPEFARRIWTKTKGVGDVTWAYTGMLLGLPGVKADVWIVRFVSDALGAQVSTRRAAALVTEAASHYEVDATDLDHAIWAWQRDERRGKKSRRCGAEPRRAG